MFRHIVRALVVSLALAGAAFAQPPAVKDKIVAKDYQTVKATITYELKTTNFAVNRWQVFTPEPPELPSQTKVKTIGDPAGKLIAEKSLLARQVRYLDINVPNPAPGSKLTIKQDIQATLRTRKLVPLDEGEKPPKVTALTAAEQKYYIAPGGEIDIDAKPFKDWLDKKQLRLKKGEQPLELAARILEVIRADYEYKFVKEDKKASLVCERTSGDCASMTYLFVGALRANKIPARALIGRFAKPRKEGVGPTDNQYDQPHVRAEMYVAGVGWVPVDPAFAHGNKKKPVGAFIGDDTGDLLVLHVDVDLRLPYPDMERTAKALQTTPNYWTFGKGTFDGVYGPTGWEVTATPIEKK